MKHVKKTILTLCLTAGLLLTPVGAAMADEQVTVTLPSFPVTLNGIAFDQTQLQYPLLVYKNITYVAMTYHDARLLGLETAWTMETGLGIEKAAFVPDQLTAQQQYVPYISDSTNINSYSAIRPGFAIKVNGKPVDNSKEEYPLLVFRDVTYFPLTWRFAVDEFGWNYTFDAENGLNISPVPTSVMSDDSQGKTAVVTGDLVNLRSGAGTNNRVAGQVTAGTSLLVLGIGTDADGKVWYQVQTENGIQGWIASWLVNVTQTAKPDSSADKNNNMQSTTTITNGTTVYVTGNVVNLRTGAGTDYERGGQVLEGDALTVVGNSTDKDGKVWYRVQMEDGARLWVASWLVSTSKAEAENSADVSTGERTDAELGQIVQDGRKTILSIRNGEGNIYSVDAVSETQLKLTLDNVNVNNVLSAQGGGFVVKVASAGNGKAAVTLEYEKGSYTDVVQEGDWLILNCYQTGSGLAGRTVVLDPGHGGADVGAEGRTMKHVTDADVGYTVACKLQKLLEDQGATVVFTRGELARNEQVFVTERIEMSNALEPDIYISIHANSTEDQTTATGAQTYTYNGKIYSQKALADNLAQKICDGLKISTSEKSVTKSANYYVLRLNNHPSVLVETAFLSNPHDEALLATDEYRQKLAEGIYAGVVEYFNQF